MFPNAHMFNGWSRVPGQLIEVFGVYSDVQKETGLAKSQGQCHGQETCVEPGLQAKQWATHRYPYFLHCAPCLALAWMGLEETPGSASSFMKWA